MISFEYPAALALVLVPPVFAVIRAVRSARRQRWLVLPLDLWNGSRTMDAPTFWRLASLVSSVLSGLAWMALALAVAGPAGESGVSPASNRGIDLVFAIDVSPSMAASDLDPTRLEAAKAFVRACVESSAGAAGASVGLVAFGAEAALVCPPTTDYATVLDRLDAIKPGILGDGTALGLGLSSAFRQLAASASPGAVAVLLSDGEDNVGLVHPADVAQSLRAYGAGLLVVGLGSPGDVPIDYVDPATGQHMSGAYRSGFDDAAMSSIAIAGGGMYRTVPDSRGLETLVTELGELGITSVEARSGSGSLIAGATMPGGGSTVKHPVGRPLFLAAMAMAAMGWSIRRLLLGGLA